LDRFFPDSVTALTTYNSKYTEDKGNNIPLHKTSKPTNVKTIQFIDNACINSHKQTAATIKSTIHKANSSHTR